MYETNYQMPVMSRKDQAIRNFFSQPKFMWLGILGLVAAVLSSFAGLFPAEPVDLSAFAELGLDVSYFDSYLSNTPKFSIDIVSILTSVAFLLFHFNAKNPMKNFKAPSTILKVLATISFVLVCVVSGLCVVLLIVFSAIGFLNATVDVTTIAVALCAILFLCIIIFAIFFLVTYVQLNFTKSLKISTTTEQTSMKGIKGYSVIVMLNGISMGFSIISAFTPTITGFNFGKSMFYLVQAVVGLIYYVLTYQFVTGFGKIIEAEEATRLFESAPYNQAPYHQVPITGEPFYNQPPHSQTPVTGEAFDNQRPMYNNPYTTPQEAVAEAVEANLCKNCGAVVNDDDYFCMKCGTRIERD